MISGYLGPSAGARSAAGRTTQRSGGSAVTETLLAATGYEGYGEGHVFDVLAPLEAGVDADFSRDVRADDGSVWVCGVSGEGGCAAIRE